MIYTDWKFDENTKTVYNVPMGSWVDIDIWPKGKAGFDARYRVDEDRLFVYCNGTDHWADWLHHFAPWAGRRQRQGAEMILRRLIPHLHRRNAVIGGYSLGGAVAAELARLIPYSVLFLAGSKRPRKRIRGNYKALKVRGDVVTALPPWRPRIRGMEKVGRWTPLFWRAHMSEDNREFLRREGF